MSVEGAANLGVSNSTFDGNWAALAGGAVVVADPSGSVHVEFSTLTDNLAPEGAGVAAMVDQVSLHGSLVGGSSSGPDCAVEGGAITATGANLGTDGTCALLAGSAVTTVTDLRLETLGDWGADLDAVTASRKPGARCRAGLCFRVWRRSRSRSAQRAATHR